MLRGCRLHIAGEAWGAYKQTLTKETGMKQGWRWVGGLGVWVVFGLVRAALGTVGGETSVYSTLDNAGGYLASSGTNITGSGGPHYQGFAGEFEPSAGGMLSSIELGITHVNEPELVDIRVALDTGGFGGPAGVSLASGSVTTAAFFGSSSTALAVFIPSTPVVVTPGTDYWVMVTPHSASSFDIWQDTTSGVIGNIAGSNDGSHWAFGPAQLQSAFRVNVVVPEAGSGAAVAVAAGILGMRRRCKRSRKAGVGFPVARG